MDATQVMSHGQEGLAILLMVAAPMLLTVLVVGLVVSIFQAATQINEATLSFVPKIVAAAAVLAFAGPWMMTTLVEYIQRTLLAQGVCQERGGRWQDAEHTLDHGTDLEAVEDGYISVTPLQVDLTHYSAMDTLAGRFSA